MKRRGWMILAATVAVGLALLLGGVVAQPPTGTKTPPQPGKNELDPGNSLSSSNGLGTEQIQALGVPSELQDAAFERYVDLALLGRAWAEMDASLLTDCGLQLAEGERVLLRPHKAISAEKVLEFAIKVAAEKKETATLDRLAKALDRAGKKDLALKIETARKLASTSRDPAEEIRVAIDEISPQGFAVCQGVLRRIQMAKLTGDPTSLGDIDRELKAAGGLPQAQREALARLVGQARSTLGSEGSKPDPVADALSKLASASRPPYPRYRIQVLNDTGTWVRIRIESNINGIYSLSPGYLPPGGTYSDQMYGGSAAYRRIYAYSSSGQLIAFKKTEINFPGLLRVPSGTDGGWISVETYIH